MADSESSSISTPRENLLSARCASHGYGTMSSEEGPADTVTTARRKMGLHRGLSARQVQMIAIAGTIGTGLFLGTGRSLSEGGPASMLICYAIIGFIVYVTLLLLGEMATQYPVAGKFYCILIDILAIVVRMLLYLDPFRCLFSVILMTQLLSCACGVNISL